MKDLNKAQLQLDEKEAELDAVRAQYEQAMMEKQVHCSLLLFCCNPFIGSVILL